MSKAKELLSIFEKWPDEKGDRDYYKSQLKSLGDVEWPNATLIISNDGKKTKNITVTPHLIDELSKWVNSQKLEYSN